MFIEGGGRIADKLANGWLFLASDRNRLAREVDLYELIDGKPVKVGTKEPEPVAVEQPVKRGPGRPRKDQSSFK